MSNITMDLVKELREKTQVGMMDCKKALEEANGDIEKAVEILRKKGAAVAQKRAENATNHGNIHAAIAPDFQSGSLVKITCETDFSANTNDMKNFAEDVSQQVLKNNPTNVEDLLNQKFYNNNKVSISDKLNDIIAKIAEKIQVEQFVKFQVKTHGFVNAYIHPGANVGVLIELETDKENKNYTQELQNLSKDICMQVVVTTPLAISPEGVDKNLVEKEIDIIKEQLKTSGKPENIIAKIAEGKLSKYYQEVCLLNQLFIKDDKITVSEYVNQVGKKTGLKISVKGFKRFTVGK